MSIKSVESGFYNRAEHLVWRPLAEFVYWSIGGLFVHVEQRFAFTIAESLDEDDAAAGLTFTSDDNGDEVRQWAVGHDRKFLNFIARLHGVEHLATWDVNVDHGASITDIAALTEWLTEFWTLVAARYVLAERMVGIPSQEDT